MKLHNTRTRSPNEFTAAKDKPVRIYTCGPTVYDYQHIGNYLGYIYWDILIRTLKEQGYDVNRVMNITDVGHLVSDADEGEDKLEKGARREGKSAWEVAEFYTQDFMNSMKELNNLTPTRYAKATDFIPEQIALIQILEQKGYTYVISDGVYFDTSKFPSYADFARLNLGEQIEGARVETNPEKRNPSDFALWKLSPAGTQRDMEWDSPWGKGFPGWHIECSAIAMNLLGETLDIHTGGIDHIPIHHTNEIAQSEAASGKRFSNFWLHNNFLLVNGTKISKSLGNGYTLADLAARGFSAMDFRLFVLQSQYRNESNFTWENLQAAKNRLVSYQAMADLRWQAKDIPAQSPDDIKNTLNEIRHALQDDLNTPIALAALSGLTDNLPVLSTQNLEVFNDFLSKLDELLGLRLSESTDIADEQKSLIAQREKAREEKNWTQADKLRAKLADQGIEINDTTYGPIWSRKS